MPTNTAMVAVRFAGNTYHARELRPKGFRCSCTSGEDHAAKALARKFFKEDATIKRLNPYPANGFREFQHLDILDTSDGFTKRQILEMRTEGVTHIIFW